MNTSSLRQPSPREYTLLMEAARREALRLRREAIAAFWHDVARVPVRALRALSRAARKLRRHPTAPPSPQTPCCC